MNAAPQPETPNPFFAGVRVLTSATPGVQRFGPFVGQLLKPGASVTSAAALHLAALLEQTPEAARERWPATAPGVALRVFDDHSALLGTTDGGDTTWFPHTFTAPDRVTTIPLYAGKSSTVRLAASQGRLLAQGAQAADRAWPAALAEIVGLWAQAQPPLRALDDPRATTRGVFSPFSPFPGLSPADTAFLDTFLHHLSVATGCAHQMRLVPATVLANGDWHSLTLRGKPADKDTLVRLFQQALGHPAWPVPPTRLLVRTWNDPRQGAPITASGHARLTAHLWFATHFPTTDTETPL